MPIAEQAIWARLSSARLRASDLCKLTCRDPANDRDRLAQECLFHLCGAIDYLAQFAAAQRLAGDPTDISISNLPRRLASGDPLVEPLQALYVNTRSVPFPKDPYSDDGYLWRIYNYRHQVTHRGANPFEPLVDFERTRMHLYLDPLEPSRGSSRETLSDDLERMTRLVEYRIKHALRVL